MKLQDLLRHVRTTRRMCRLVDEEAAAQLATVNLSVFTEQLRTNVLREQAKIASDEGLLTEFRDLEQWIKEMLRAPRAERDKAAVTAGKKYFALLERQLRGFEQ